MGVAQEEVKHAVSIHHRRTQAAGSRVDKTTTLPVHWAIGFGSDERSGQAQEEVMSFDSQRFLAAQKAVYDQVVEELSQGQKTTHWIWFVFPQLTGLGRSERAKRFGISGIDEARAYLQHPVLGPRLTQCTDLVLSHKDKALTQMLGSVDAQKFYSCVTLFHLADPAAGCFKEALELYFQGSLDQGTLGLLDTD
jgi:uncharacterized protein (DUF1810 family)